ncbi:ElyC/SanA/YdcF family protein [Streptoalloteichus tenebrarius]|uniref:ElyC/SanA/YdcF family protein n=1 Tax=Streptoalloteichus tenebrarius (strain ATCC 17920 / DSM 40477 / JCM 4838 / CBS 697.72 / NBRC 16177 / NCIMB 11028 / NRRL B-12390 / A12253. 1 / ISP 5477) TaxID=1933 RepID=UPI0035E60477
MLVEPNATNTGQNIELSRKVLQDARVAVDSVLLISMPYMERRAYVTCAKQWSEVSVVCASAPRTYREHVATVGDERLVIDDLVGDLQRIIEYPALGYAIPQEIPPAVMAAYERLVGAGFTSRLIGNVTS